MACLDMYNSEHKMGHHHNNNHSHSHNHHLHHHHHSHLMASPRISFSNDFVDAQQAMRQEIMRSSRSSSEAVQVSSDFEFSVTNYSMMSADELFFKGRLLPYKENNVVSCNNTTSSSPSSSSSRTVTTLRDELLQGDHDVTSRPAKGSSWKSLLGLKRAHYGGSSSKKPEKGVDCTPRTLTMLGHQEAHVSKTSQDWSNEDGDIGL